MDDLVKDHYIKQDKLLEKRNKQKKKAKTKAKKIESSYDDEDSKEARLTRIVEKCHNQATSFYLFLSLFD